MTAVVECTVLFAEALFVSDLQPSDHPGTRLVSDVVTAVVFHCGQDRIAARVAQEYGDHPDEAVKRMRWCCVRIAEAFG